LAHSGGDRGPIGRQILVAFDGPATSARDFGVQFYLEDLFDCAVDLVTEEALRAELRPYIEREAVHV
jgi:predicted nucleotidyltransferase